MDTSNPNGINASIWAHPISETSQARTWAREREPGAAFKGLSRGRGRGRGRGSGKGRGATTLATEVSNGVTPFGKGSHTPIQTSHEPPLSARAAAMPDTPRGRPLDPPSISQKTSKPKPAAHRASQQQATPKVPTLTVDTSGPAPNEEAPPMSPLSSSRRGPRRKRSRQHSLPASATAVRGPSAARPDNVYNVTSPLSAAPSKDLPPHISAFSLAPASIPAPAPVPASDMRQNIDNLVERVRAIAMENNRPGTPGTHIDWAGDDDDSLPDLNDWVVNSKPDEKPAASNGSGGLTPVAENVTTATVVSNQSEFDGETSKGAESQTSQILDEQQSHTSDTKLSPVQKSKRESRGERRRGRGREKDKGGKNVGQNSPPLLTATIMPREPLAGSSPPMSTAQKRPRTIPQPLQLNGELSDQLENFKPSDAKSTVTETKLAPKFAHHPSLPPKPTTPAASSGSTGRTPTLPPFPPTKPDGASWRQAVKADSLNLGKEIPSRPTDHSEADKPLAPREGSRSSTTDNNERVFSSAESTKKISPKEETLLRPSDMPSKSPGIIQSPPLNDASPMHSPNLMSSRLTPNLPERQHSRSGSLTPRHWRDRSPQKSPSHGRAHSSPQPSPGTTIARTRTPQATRPIISLGAIHMISKTLGSEPTRREAKAE